MKHCANAYLYKCPVSLNLYSILLVHMVAGGWLLCLHFTVFPHTFLVCLSLQNICPPT